MELMVWMGVMVILASCEHPYIRIHENLVQYPSNNISIVLDKLLFVINLIEKD